MKNNQKQIGILLSYAIIFVNAIISFVYTPVMLNYVGQAEYGIFSLAQSFISYLAIMQTALGSSYIVQYAKLENEAERAKLNATFMVIYLGMAMLVFVLGFVILKEINLFFGASFRDHEAELFQELFIIMILNLIITILGSTFASYITANEKFFFQKVLVLIGKLFSPLISLPLLICGYKSLALAMVSLLIALVQFLARWYFCVKRVGMSFDFSHIMWKRFREIFELNLFILIHSVSEQLYQQVDRSILMKFFNSAVVAIYTIGIHFNEMFITLSRAITVIYTPKLHVLKEKKDREGLNILVEEIGKIQFIILGMAYVVLICYGKEFFLLWAGEEYEDAYYVAIIVLAPIIWAKSQEMYIEMSRGGEAYIRYVLATLCFGILNVGISIPCCWLWGVTGCALGTAISLLIQETLFMRTFIKKYLYLDWKTLVIKRIKILPTFIGLIMIGMLPKKILCISGWSMLLGQVCCFGVIACCLIYIMVLDDDEREAIKRLLTLG